jgi:predicted DNA-binding protein (MmcQ/YjbR family)
MLSEAQILRRLPRICHELPRATETITFGHPTFQVDGKVFGVLEQYKGELGICVKIEKQLQGIILDDARFFRTPYIGKHGWVTLLKALVRRSYRLVAAGRPRLGSKSKRKSHSSLPMQ